MEAVLRPCAEQRHPDHHQHGRGEPARRREGDGRDRAALGPWRASRSPRLPATTCSKRCGGGDYALLERPGTVASLGDRIARPTPISAPGRSSRRCEGGADVVITGRVGDPALFLAPLVHEFGWAMDDWDRLGRGTVVGHLLECAGQITGGYFADPGYKDVPDLARLGFPIAEVSEDGSAVITKVEGSGGRIGVANCKEQLLYELLDPSGLPAAGRDRGFLRGEFHRAGARPHRGERRHRAAAARYA